ncbi:flagellin N-terminal helical domain-containing protein [Aporhodopirellula aestuarii]|uniref:Flagellar hook protein n=1 Tax=Aporhodopirellula aestuarii TaxID=2950107 RepID=A0ABT0UC73_9BACT|nr:flagellin hook IN motif-containing protein [Aporhodopirellula aestuarii]MCM2374319.1 flagellar hook protein [Aporhodopirellula aestuarii]
MALLPVSTNRVSTPLNNQRLLYQLNNDQLAIQRQYDQLSTGRRVLRMSDDPAAASRAIGYQRGISYSEQLVRNANATEAFYQSTDVVLNRVDNALIEARGAAVEGAQSILSEDQREALAMTIRQSMESIVSAGNGMFNDHQLLGGVLENQAALEFENDTVRFNGTEAVGQTKLGSGTGSSFTVTGATAIGVGGTFQTGHSLDAGINEDTRLVDLRQGLGVEPGVITLSDGDNHVELDLRNAATIGDVVDVLRTVELGGRALGVSLGTDSISIQYADALPGTLAVIDAEGSSLAQDLDIANPLGYRAPPLVGDRLSPRVTASTNISDLASGAGLDLSSGLVIQRGEQSFTIDFDDAETIGDVLISINRSDAGVRAELDEVNGRIELRALYSGVDYSVGENGGIAASELGIRTADADTLLSDLAGGLGLSLNPNGPDLVITRPDGIDLEFELEGAATIQDVMNLVANHPDNQDTRRVRIALNTVGNGLQLTAPTGTQPITVTQPGLSDAGTYLGWIKPGESEAVAQLNVGVSRLTGEDYRPREAGGAIDTLLRLERAVRDGDIAEIGRLQTQLDTDLDTSSRTRGRVGVWTQSLNEMRSAIEDENVLLQSQLSNELDADLATVISDLGARQASLEASMRFIGQTSSLTVLNYL